MTQSNTTAMPSIVDTPADAPPASEPRVSFADPDGFDAAVAAAVAAIRRDGMVVLDDVADPAVVARCHDHIRATYPELATPDRERNYGPYAGRHCMPMVLDTTLADRALMLPRAYRAIARALLGDGYMVDSIGLLVAVPGAPDQIAHADGHLFPEANLEPLLPTFALACSMPLVRMDGVSGRTAFWRGSHRKGKAHGAHDVAPVVDPGSALIWDFRTYHCGLANTGTAPRPTIFTVLSREWWVEMHPPEATRYEKLLMQRDVHAALSKRDQHRFHRATLVD
ncbi:hypothetical protein ASE86_14700 [Sphingomonas sp. Leaf33]|uniref:phytanoyl-CoA dioxygenase family protein n=1 Tax=Sphingomonas sp. Leaf33 TaxID=1736215 RepID=UPI000701CE2B|nr:phytanoyl-CoA dioxygenase family protein [Sphingomonas sp. Leaf33]KQN21221.1 hypothetical protein ASE86_14700 [Sphingomonas sp. Leaf33]